MALLLAALLLLQQKTAEKLVEELGANDIEVRAKAQQELRTLGKAALPAPGNSGRVEGPGARG